MDNSKVQKFAKFVRDCIEAWSSYELEDRTELNDKISEIGAAVGVTAYDFWYLYNTTKKDGFEKNSPLTFIVGLPLNDDGDDHPVDIFVHSFGKSLGRVWFSQDDGDELEHDGVEGIVDKVLEVF